MVARRGSVKQKANVIISDMVKPVPELHEIEAAWILADHFGCMIEFLRPIRGYKVRSADIVMNGNIWEIKSPTGVSRHTVEYLFKKALHQSRHIVIDGRRTKLTDQVIQTKIGASIHMHPRVERVIFISKQKRVIEILK